MLWCDASEKARISERGKSTNRLKLHPHALRKFLHTKIGAVIPVDVVEALMDHEQYITEVHRGYSPKELAKFYLEGGTDPNDFWTHNRKRRTSTRHQLVVHRKP
jgi:hypothetical protein